MLNLIPYVFTLILFGSIFLIYLIKVINRFKCTKITNAICSKKWWYFPSPSTKAIYKVEFTFIFEKSKYTRFYTADSERQYKKFNEGEEYQIYFNPINKDINYGKKGPRPFEVIILIFTFILTSSCILELISLLFT